MKNSSSRIASRYHQKILDAFIALAHEMPYPEITVLRVTQEAKISRQTFYRHFPSKDALLAAMMQKIVDGVTQRLQSLQQPTRKEIFYTYFTFWQQHANFLRLLCEGEAEAWLIKEYGKVMQTQLEILRPHFSSLNEREFYLLKSFLIGGFYQLKYDWCAKNFRESPEVLANFVEKLLA